MKVKSESEVTQLCLTLSDPMDRSLPGSSIHGIFQARVLRGSPLPSPRTIRNLLYKPISLSLCVLRIRVFQISFHTEYIFTEIYIIKPCQSKVSIFIIKTWVTATIILNPDQQKLLVVKYFFHWHCSDLMAQSDNKKQTNIYLVLWLFLSHPNAFIQSSFPLIFTLGISQKWEKSSL